MASFVPIEAQRGFSIKTRPGSRSVTFWGDNPAVKQEIVGRQAECFFNALPYGTYEIKEENGSVYSVSFDIAPGASGSPPEYFIRAILYKIHTHREQHGKHNRYEIKIGGSYEIHVGLVNFGDLCRSLALVNLGDPCKSLFKKWARLD